MVNVLIPGINAPLIQIYLPKKMSRLYIKLYTLIPTCVYVLFPFLDYWSNIMKHLYLMQAYCFKTGKVTLFYQRCL